MRSILSIVAVLGLLLTALAHAIPSTNGEDLAAWAVHIRGCLDDPTNPSFPVADEECLNARLASPVAGSARRMPTALRVAYNMPVPGNGCIESSTLTISCNNCLAEGYSTPPEAVFQCADPYYPACTSFYESRTVKVNTFVVSVGSDGLFARSLAWIVRSETKFGTDSLLSRMPISFLTNRVRENL